MRKFLPAALLVLAALAGAAEAQNFEGETVREASEKVQSGDRAGAFAVLDGAIARGKDLRDAYLMRADLRAIDGDFEAALDDYTAAIGVAPEDAGLYVARAFIRGLRRDHAGAVEDLTVALTHGSEADRIYTARARVKEEMGDTDGAIADCQAALVVNPAQGMAVNRLASLLERQKNDPEAAAAQLQDFLRRYEAGARAAVRRAEVVTTSRPGSPAGFVRRALLMEQEDNLAVAYADLGRLYAKMNDLDRALESYEKGLKIRSDSSYLHDLRSRARLRRGDPKGAIKDLQAAVENPLTPADQHFNQGILLLLQGKDAEAEREFAQQLQKFPESKKNLAERIEEAKSLRAHRPRD